MPSRLRSGGGLFHSRSDSRRRQIVHQAATGTAQADAYLSA